MNAHDRDGFVLHTQRLDLRELRVGLDEPFVLKLFNEPGFVRYVGDKGIRTLEDAAGYIRTQMEGYRKHGFGVYLVELSGSGEPIGICGLLRRPPIEDVEVGFGYLESAWGKGYAFEAASPVIRLGFEALGLPRIVALTAPDNNGSINVLRKLGMRFEQMVPLPGFDVERKLFGLDRTKLPSGAESANYQE